VREVKYLAAKAAAAPPAPVAPPASPPAAPPTEPPAPAGATPSPPTPPDPETARRREADLQRWIALLRDPNEGIAFTATRKLAEFKDLRVVPPLVDVLKTHRDYFTRQGAALTLGEIQAADAVPALMDALEDKDDTVQAASNEALTQITQQDFKFSLVLTKKEKKQIKEQWNKWWKENEGDVRKRLGQPRP
jgi:HEAT repeat protein